MESSHEESVAVPVGACSNSSNSCSSTKTTTTTTTTTTSLYALRQNPKRSHRLIETGITSDRDHHHRHPQRLTGAAGGSSGTTATSAEPPPPRKPLAAACDGGGGVPQPPPPPPLAKACSECGKEFSSWKALFGHMRCHPERQWRGILPPRSHNTMAAPPHIVPAATDTAAANSVGTNANADTLALAPPGQLLIKKKRKKKKKKKKRKMTAAAGTKLVLDDCFLSPHLLVNGNGDANVDGNAGNFSDSQSIEKAYVGAGRRPGGYYSGISERQIYRRLQVPDQLPDATAAAAAMEDEDDHDMADCLVMLAFASSAAFHKEEDDDGEEEEEEKEEDQDADNNGGGRGAISGGGCGGGRVEEEQRIDIKRLDCFPAPPLPKIIRKRAAPRRTQNLLWRKEEDGGGGGGGAPRGLEEYKCSACKRIFRSHQALGGHRASHKKVKGCFARTNSPTSTADAVTGAAVAPEIKGLLTKLETARTELHLELHLATPASAPSPAATATIAADIGSEKPEKQPPPPLAPKFLDLNLPPPMDTHEEEDLLNLKTAGAFLALW